MHYPITLTKEEFEAASKIGLDAKLEEYTGTPPSITADKFLDDVVFYTYESAIYSAGDRYRANNIINTYDSVLEPQIKALLIKVAEYMLKNIDEDTGLYSGVVPTNDGGVTLLDTQEVITRILPPNVMTYVMNIKPNIVYSGGGY